MREILFKGKSDNTRTDNEFKGVIMYHHPLYYYYEEKNTSENNLPNCRSMDGRIGINTETGEVRQCADCPNGKFGSGENGAKACKQKRRIFLLKEGEPMLFNLNAESIVAFSKYVLKLLSKGKKTNSVVTKFAIKETQKADGILYSLVAFSIDRDLTKMEQNSVDEMTEKCKILTKVSMEVKE